MPRKPALRQTKVLLSIGLALLMYGGAYVGLRSRHYFIHRACRSGDPATNHSVTPGQVTDGPQVFGAAMLALATTHQDPTDKEMETALAPFVERIAAEERRRKTMLVFFQPLACLEVVLWRIVDPNPKV